MKLFRALIIVLVLANSILFMSIEWGAVASGSSVATRPSYETELMATAKRLRIEADWLRRTIQAESGGNPAAQNEYGHVGHIQFAPTTAKGLGYSPGQIKAMSPTEQLKPIEAFYRPAIGRIRSYADMRVFTFFPLALGKPDTFVLQAPGSPAALIAKRNPSFDTDNDGQITVGEYKSQIK